EAPGPARRVLEPWLDSRRHRNQASSAATLLPARRRPAPLWRSGEIDRCPLRLSRRAAVCHVQQPRLRISAAVRGGNPAARERRLAPRAVWIPCDTDRDRYRAPDREETFRSADSCSGNDQSTQPTC